MTIKIKFKNFLLRKEFLELIENYDYECKQVKGVIIISDPDLEDKDEEEEFESEVFDHCIDVVTNDMPYYVDYYCEDKSDKDITEKVLFKNNIPYCLASFKRTQC
jgi:hypothetical protein